jgi:hypothetical protein
MATRNMNDRKNTMRDYAPNEKTRMLLISRQD